MVLNLFEGNTFLIIWKICGTSKLMIQKTYKNLPRRNKYILENILLNIFKFYILKYIIKFLQSRDNNKKKIRLCKKLAEHRLRTSDLEWVNHEETKARELTDQNRRNGRNIFKYFSLCCFPLLFSSVVIGHQRRSGSFTASREFRASRNVRAPWPRVPVANLRSLRGGTALSTECKSSRERRENCAHFKPSPEIVSTLMEIVRCPSETESPSRQIKPPVGIYFFIDRQCRCLRASWLPCQIFSNCLFLARGWSMAGYAMCTNTEFTGILIIPAYQVFSTKKSKYSIV